MKTNTLAKRATLHSTVDNADATPPSATDVEGGSQLTGSVVTVATAQKNSAQLKFGDASDDTQDQRCRKTSAQKHLTHDTADPSEDKKKNPAGAVKPHGVLHAKGLRHALNVERSREANGQREEDPDPSGDQGAKSLTIGDMNMAVAFDAVMEKDFGKDEKVSSDPRPSKRGDDRFEREHGTRDLFSVEGTLPAAESRVEYLAMVAVPGGTTLASPQLGKTTGLRALRPKSRVECERRCGSDGFCDPSDERGCGGEFCIRLKLPELF
ncbi:hypothetical protein ACFQUU_27310 [Herbaspirillum sp. GCM10030257]|uniref:hypothetical protein n=1 Tax=Herbaspirillum sp. GCM10030257 TaxID=3273393 RepID=UPI0036096348